MSTPRKLNLPKAESRPENQLVKPKKLDLAAAGSKAAEKILQQQATTTGNIFFKTSSGTTGTVKKPATLNLQPASAAPDTDIQMATVRDTYPDLYLNHKVALASHFASLEKATDISLISWGDASIKAVQKATDLLVEMSKRFALIDAQRWIDGALRAANPPKGFFARVFDKDESPVFYEAMMQKTKSELSSLLVYIDESKRQVEEAIPLLRMALVSLQVFMTTKVLADSQQRIATNRLASLTMSHQSSLQFIQSCNNSRTEIINQIQQIDHVLSVTLPQWKIAHAARR